MNIQLRFLIFLIVLSVSSFSFADDSDQAPISSDVYAAMLMNMSSNNESVSTAIYLTGNDTDGDILAFELLTGPQQGTLSDPNDENRIISSFPYTVSTPALRYTPPVGFSGVVTFEYRTGDGLNVSSLATATITVFDRYRINQRQIGDYIDQTIPSSIYQQSNGQTIAVDVSGDGRTIAVGEPNYADGRGRVRIYTLSGSNWEQLGTDIGGGQECFLETPLFGFSVSLSSDGRTVAIGSPGKKRDGLCFRDPRGFVYLFRFDSDQIGDQSTPYWRRESISYSESFNFAASYGEYLGHSVSISSDGQTFAASSRNGVVKVFRGESKIAADYLVWRRVGEDINHGATEDQGGLSLSLNADGTTVAIGSKRGVEGSLGDGHVGVYSLTDNGWAMLGQYIEGAAAGNRFGASVSLADDGRSIAVGAPQATVNDIYNAGHVRVFDFYAENWIQRGQPIGGTARRDSNSDCCISVSLSGDGQTLAVGWYWVTLVNNNNNGIGVAKIYSWSDSEWLKLGADIDTMAQYSRGAARNEVFVSLATDGQTVAVTVPVTEGIAGGEVSGRVQILDLTDSSPIISGESKKVAIVGQPFIFTPSVNDPDPVQALLFSATSSSGGLPPWISLDDSTGVLQGTPNSTDTGLFSDISLRVKDESFQDVLPSFHIEVIEDTDLDGMPNNCASICVEEGYIEDNDDDNDGVLDTNDAYPLISFGDLTDTDGDGAPDDCDQACIDLGMAADTDDDNDGVLDSNDELPLDPTNDSDGDGYADDIDICPFFNGNYEGLDETQAQADIVRLELCFATGETGPKLEFLLVLSENFNLSKNAGLLFWLESNEQTWISLSREDTAEPLRATVMLNELAASGTYTIRSLRITDDDGLLIALNEGQLNSLGFNTAAILDNKNSDSVKPALTSFLSEGWVVDSESRPVLDASIEVLEEGSGLGNGRAILELLSPTGTSIQVDANFTAQGSADFSISLPKYAASGQYQVNTVRFYDLAGNSQFSKDWLAQYPQTFQLDNPIGDQEASELVEFSLQAVFDNSSDRPVIKISGAAVDEISGAQSVYLRLLRPEGGDLDKWVTSRQSDQYLKFSNDIPLTTQFMPGKYEVQFVRLVDVAGNQVRYSTSDLEGMGNQISSYINVFFPEAADIESGNTSVNGSDDADFVFGSNSSNDSIDAGSGDDEIYTGDGDDEVDAGPGNDIIIGGSGGGDDRYIGGSGIDKIIYSSAYSEITVDLVNGYAQGADIGLDQIESVENIVAGQGGDNIYLDASNNYAYGAGGNDTFFESPLQGDDYLFGDEGDDTFEWSVESGGSLNIYGGSGANIYRPLTLSTLNQVVLNDFDFTSGDLVDLSLFWDNDQEVFQDLIGGALNVTDVISLSEGNGFVELVFGKAGDSPRSILKIESQINVAALTAIIDSDGDGVADNSDAFPLNSAETVDTDSDSIGNNADTDDDSDGVLDANDAYPLISLNGLTDTDFDGLPDECDSVCLEAGMTVDADDDGDGVDDAEDVFPLDSSEQIDTDADGVGDNADPYPDFSDHTLDSDSDGMPDAWEARYGLDPNDPADAISDQDNDGVSAYDEFIAGTIPAGSLDIDGNGQYDALTDGLLLLRGMFGLSEVALISGAVASDADYKSSSEIMSRIEMLGDLVDIDGNGRVDALTDGLIILRYLFGLRGDVLINGVIASDATVTSADGVSAKMESLMPAL